MYSRGPASLRARELITVAVLAAMGRERQLVSHLPGAAWVGASGAELRRALRVGATAAAGRATARRAWSAAYGAALTSAGSPP
ncbi:MAG: carboxymuconolactone decarboxylase family protein [Candidatus Eisenbacteria bacterium]